jgi:hypothetical protein
LLHDLLRCPKSDRAKRKRQAFFIGGLSVCINIYTEQQQQSKKGKESGGANKYNAANCNGANPGERLTKNLAGGLEERPHIRYN